LSRYRTENQEELHRVADELRATTQQLCRNLRDNPDVADNMVGPLCTSFMRGTTKTYKLKSRRGWKRAAATHARVIIRCDHGLKAPGSVTLPLRL
jgi:hypothetical protein